MRRFMAALGVCLFTTGAVHAGDAAELNILGFSANGGVFAFEEFGVQDGSGFPYAHRFYINTATDRFLPNTPVRVRIEDERATVDTARAEARRRGEKVIRDAELAANRGYTVGLNAIGELNADRNRMVVNPRPVFPAIDDPLEFRAEPIGVPTPSRCENLGDIVGLRVLRVHAQQGAATEVLHVDRDAIPLSRGCPTGYGIGAVQTFHPRAGDPVFALVITVERFGFEGPDHRYMAITGPLAE